jgi:small multidrug resistance family-3 protein
MTVTRSLVLFLAAALAEIGGAWLVWQGIREHRGWLFVGAGVVALGLYGFVATLQPDAHFGRILAAYGGVFVAGSLAWGMVVDGFRPDRYDVSGALICLVGVAVIMYAPRPAWGSRLDVELPVEHLRHRAGRRVAEQRRGRELRGVPVEAAVVAQHRVPTALHADEADPGGAQEVARRGQRRVGLATWSSVPCTTSTRRPVRSSLPSVA